MLAVASLSPTFDVQDGDRFERHGSMILQIRTIDSHDQVVKSAAISELRKVEYGSYVVVGNNRNVNKIILELKMPGANDTIANVTESPTGAVTFHYGSGTSDTHDSWADVGSIADEIDTDGNFARKLLKAKAYRESPNGENKTALVGAIVTVNIQPATMPIVYTPPQN